jgi:hypothetical protein
VPGPGDAGVILDARAKQVYRRRLVEIEEDLAEAEARCDLGRAEQARREREFLERELSRAVGLGGRDRRAGVASDHHASLAAHLERTIRTGTYYAYLPDPQASVQWTVEP